MSHDLRHLNATTLADQAYASLRTAIIVGDLKSGEKITDRGLADSLAVSPTPVREAIRRLEQDRLVERTGPRTVRVAVYSDSQRAEISQVADSLKAVAARLAATNITEDELVELTACLDSADAERAHLYAEVVKHGGLAESVKESASRLIAILREFHDRINQASRNEILLHLLHTVEAFGVPERQQALHRQIARQTHKPNERYGQHREILDALVDRDADLVERLVLAHTRSASMDLLGNS